MSRTKGRVDVKQALGNPGPNPADTSGHKARRGGLWNRFAWSIAGPPQLGDLRAPIRPSAPDTDICRRCGEPLVEHEAVHAKGNSLLKCRTDDDGAASQR